MLSSTRRQLREEKILLSLSKMKFATREQLQGVKELELGNDRNALKVLGQMKELIQWRNHLGKNVYFLARKGADMIGVENLPNWNSLLEHHLLRNDMYIYYGCPADWRTEAEVILKPAMGDEKVIIPDATFMLNEQYHFLEVDRTQSMVENRKKIDLYAMVNPIIKHHFQTYPKLIFYTTTSTRRETLTKHCEEKNLDFHIFTKQDLA